MSDITKGFTFDNFDNKTVTDTRLNALVDEAVINNGVITTAKLDDLAVTDEKLAAGAVTTPKIVDLAVTTDKLANNVISTGKIADDAVTTAKIDDLAVTTAKLADQSVTPEKIEDLAVITQKIASQAVTTAKIEESGVTTAKLATEAVTTDKLAPDSVTTGKIVADAVTTPKIEALAVTTAKIDNLAVTEFKIADDAVITAKINNNAVTTGKIDDLAVTTSKIGSLAVTTAKIDNGAVTSEKIANDAVGIAQIAPAFQLTPAGVMIAWWGTSLPSGHWVWANGQSIGDSTSVGTQLTTDSCETLFKLLWGAGATAFQVYDETGDPIAHGANADADWDAHYSIATPDMRGRVGAGADAMGAASAASRLTTDTAGFNANGDAIGTSGGAEKHDHDAATGDSNGLTARISFTATDAFHIRMDTRSTATWTPSRDREITETTGTPNAEGSTGAIVQGNTSESSSIQPTIICGYIIAY